MQMAYLSSFLHAIVKVFTKLSKDLVKVYKDQNQTFVDLCYEVGQEFV